MIAKEVIRTTLEKTEPILQMFRELIPEQAYFYIFPFTIQGCVNVTETGLKPEALNVNDYTYFSKVVDGLHPVVATWEKSTRWIGSPTRYKHMQNEMGAKKRYEVGRFMMGAIEQDIQGLMISSNQAYGAEMTNLQESQELSLLTTSKLEREDIFKLYIVKRFDALDNYSVTPDTDLKGLLDRNAVQFLYLAEARNYYSPYKGKFIYSKLTFKSLNDKLADSGYSVANYIQLARAGEGYAWPRLKYSDKKLGFTINDLHSTNEVFDRNKIKVVIDPWRTIDVGVWGCQIKIDNTAIVHSVRLTGYPATWDPGEGDRDEHGNIKYNTGFVFAPRPLFPKYFLPAVNHPLNTQLKAEDSYRLVVGIQPVIDFNQEWKENKKSAYDETVRSSFEGHIRTDYKATTDVKFSIGGADTEQAWQIWKNFWYVFGTKPKQLADWPEWLIDRITYHLPLVLDTADMILDMPRSLFSNVFSRKLPQWGNMNEKIKWVDLKAPTIAKILALNAFAHHDIITLPMAKNHTITTETLDVVGDVTSRIPVIGGLMNNIIQGFHNLVFGKSPSGFKKGGVDHRLDYYGKSMVGLMSKPMYDFYTGPYYKSLDEGTKGIMPFNAFQDQGNEPLSTLLNATSNSTVLNFKVTDIVEASVYNMRNIEPEVKRVETLSTVHIAQTPSKEKDNDWTDDRKKNPKNNYGPASYTADWDKDDVVLVDKNFNTLVDPRESKVISRFGPNSDDNRLYVVNEVCVQAIGAGDMTVTFFAQDPTIYGYEQVSIWEGKFRNLAKVSKSTRGWTTTIRFGQPRILDEDGTEKWYRYPHTILADIQKRPNLPPVTIEEPENPVVPWIYKLEVYEEYENYWDRSFCDAEEARDGGGWIKGTGVELVFHTQSLPLFLKDGDKYLVFGTYSYSQRVVCWYEQDQLGKLVREIKLNKANAVFEPLPDNAHPYYLRFFSDNKALTYQPVFTDGSYKYSSTSPGKVPPLSTPWVYWHAYVTKLNKWLEQKGDNSDIPNYESTISLWYTGLYKDIN